MKPIKWSLYEGSKHVDSGTVYAEDDRDALSKVLSTKGDKVVDEKSYRVKAGELSTTSYGDEFNRTSRAASMGTNDKEQPVRSDGYQFESPINKDSVSQPAKTNKKVTDETQRILADTAKRMLGRRYSAREVEKIVESYSGKVIYVRPHRDGYSEHYVDQLIEALCCPARPRGSSHRWRRHPRDHRTQECVDCRRIRPAQYHPTPEPDWVRRPTQTRRRD